MSGGSLSAEMELTLRRSAAIVAEGREITLTPDLLTIQRKTFKQSSSCLFAFALGSTRSRMT